MNGQPADFGYTIRVDGFTAIAAEAKAANEEVAKVDQSLRKLATSGGATPFNAIDAARSRAAANAGRTFTAPGGAGGAGGLSYAALPDDSATRIGTSTAAWEKYETAANSAALATGNAAKAAGGLSNFQVGAVAVGAAATALNFAGDALAEFAGKEKEIAQLSGQLKTLGDGVKVTAEDIARLADELQAATNIDDTVFINAASELLERNVPQEGLKGALKLTADLIGVTGNADKAVQMLSQAYAGSNMMLNRYGAGLSEASTQQERLDALLRLAEQGAAQNTATVNTLAGAYDRLKGKLGDFKENVGRGLESTFGLSNALNALGDIVGGTDAAVGDAARSVDDFGDAMRDAAQESDGLAAAAGRVTQAARDAAAADEQWRAGNRRAKRQEQEAANAAERAAAEAHARELRDIARQEADGTVDSAGAKRLRDQVEAARAMEDTARKAAEAQTELERLKRTEAELAEKAREVGEAYNALDPEQRAAAAADLDAAREALRQAEEARQDAEERLDDARSAQSIAKENAERQRLENLTEQRRAAEKDAEAAAERAEKERERADKERKRNIEILADAIEKGRKEEDAAREREAAAEESERRKNRPDGRKKIRSFGEEESRQRDAERMAPDQTAGSGVFEQNKQRAADAKAAAESAAKTSADIVALTQVLGGTIGGNFAAVVSALEALQKGQAELERKLSAIRG